MFVFIQILSGGGPLPILFVYPVSPDFPDMFHRFAVFLLVVCLSIFFV